MRTWMGWIVLGLCACSPAPAQPEAPQPAPQPEAPPAEQPVQAAEVVGFWTGDWGQLVLRDVDGEIRGAYSHDQGTVTGTFADGVFRGWWCEVPSRQPTADAGEVEFRFARGGSSLDLDGRWRYGTEGAWKENWDLTHSTDAPPAELVARFDDPSAFCRR